jgi:hypothetical protein
MSTSRRHLLIAVACVLIAAQGGCSSAHESATGQTATSSLSSTTHAPPSSSPSKEPELWYPATAKVVIDGQVTDAKGKGQCVNEDERVRFTLVHTEPDQVVEVTIDGSNGTLTVSDAGTTLGDQYLYSSPGGQRSGDDATATKSGDTYTVSGHGDVQRPRGVPQGIKPFQIEFACPN